MDAYEMIRLLNLFLSIALLFVANMRVTRDWRHWTRREKVVRIHLSAYLFILAYGTAEAMTQDAAIGLRIFMLLAVHVSFAAALWRTRNDPPR